MKVLVISDIHGDTENVEKLADKFGEADNPVGSWDPPGTVVSAYSGS